MLDPIKNTDLTNDDMQLMADALNDYLESFDADDEFANGVEDPQAKHAAIENLYGRLIGVDFDAIDDVLHHPECCCDWCNMERGHHGGL